MKACQWFIRRAAACARHLASAPATPPAPAVPTLDRLEPRLQLDGAAPLADGPLLPDLIPWASKQRSYIHGWHLDRTEKPGRTLLRLSTAMANIGAGPLEVRAGQSTRDRQKVHQRIYNSDGTFTDRPAGNFTYHPSHNHVHFDDFAEYRLRAVTPEGAPGKILRSGSKISFCLTDSDEYDVALPGASENGKYFSCTGRKQGISVGWADVYGDSLVDQWVDVTGVKPGKYFLEVIVDPANRILEADETNNATSIPITLKSNSRPRNDRFAHRKRISGEIISIRGNNANASGERGEPQHESLGGSSIWYAWTAPRSGAFAISTAGSAFDTLLSIYTGDSLTTLKRIAGNDDDKAVRTSRVVLKAQKGVTYQIAVDGYRAATGIVRLSIIPAPKA